MLPSTLSMNSRLHFMFVLVVIGITIYLYFVYREIRNYDVTLRALKSEIFVLKKQLNTVEQQQAVRTQALEQASGLHSCAKPTQSHQEPIRVVDSGKDDVVDPPVEMVEEDPDGMDEQQEDDMSVTSNEIHDIITNIVHVSADDGTGSGEEGDVHIPRASTRQPKDHSSMPDLTQYSMEDLCKLKYDDLRNFLRGRGVVMKGTKQELSAKIKELAGSDGSYGSVAQPE